MNDLAMKGQFRRKLKKSVLICSLLLLVFSFPIYSFGKCIKGDCKNGQGTFTYPDGTKYVGEFKDGKWNGQGILTYPDGGKYVGEWKDHEKNGLGVRSYPDGTKYVGEFKDGKQNGQGMFALPDGGKYVGEFKDGKAVKK